MLYREIIAVCSEIHRVGKTENVLMLNLAVHEVTTILCNKQTNTIMRLSTHFPRRFVLQ
jgi:hypothetical protein